MNTLSKSFARWFFVLCSLVATINLAQSQCSIVRIIETDPSCELSNGSITIIMDDTAGPYQYTINNGGDFQSSNVFENLPEGDYLVYVIDANGCRTPLLSPQLANSGFPVLNYDVDQCVNDSEFSFINLTVTNSRPPLDFEWEGPNGFTSTDQDPGLLIPGEYTVTVTDELGCMVDTVMTVVKCCGLVPQCGDKLSETLSCFEDVPAIPGAFLDDAPTGANEDEVELSNELDIEIVSLKSCSPITVTAKDSIGDGVGCAADPMLVYRKYTVKDDFSSFTCEKIFTIVDDITPVITSPAQDQNVICGDPTKPIDEEFQNWLDANGYADATDCNNYAWSTIPENPVLDKDCSGLNLVTFVATDDCGNSSSTEASFIVMDDVAPSIVCPDPLVIEVGEADVQAKVDAWLNNITVADNCGEVSISYDYDAANFNFECGPAGSNPITFIIEDECGNMNSCVSSIDIDGMVGTQITCQQDLVLDCENPNNDQLIQDWLGQAQAIDGNGALISVDNDFTSVSPSGCQTEIDVRFSAQDACGVDVYCLAKIRIFDTMGPELICPTDLTIQLGDSDAENKINDWLNNVNVTDQCSNASVTNDFFNNGLDLDCGPIPDMLISFLAVDDCGNTNDCNASIVFEGSRTLDIICPQELVIECSDPDKDAKIAAWISEVVATDDAGNTLDVNDDYTSIGLVECDQQYPVNFNSNDLCGNNANCTGFIRFIDTEAPLIDCPDKLVLNSKDGDNNQKLFEWLNAVISDDDCSNVSLINDMHNVYIDLNCGATGDYQIEFTATDACDNSSSCIGEIEVIFEDEVNIFCPDPLSLECGDTNNEQMIQDWLTNATAQNLDGSGINVSNNYSGLPSDVCDNEIFISFAAVDGCGFVITCESSILIEDTQAPDVICANDLEINIEDFDMSLIDEWLSNVSAEDRCGAVNLANDFDPNNISGYCNEDIPVIFNAVDECGNTTDCAANIRIVDLEKPIITCNQYLEFDCSDLDIESIIMSAIDDVSVEDNSGDVELWDDFDPAILDQIDCTTSSSFEIMLNAIDGCDNESGCMIFVDVRAKLEVYIPNIFTPNEDGLNDRFTIYGNEFAKRVKSLSVYDRWGNLAFEAFDFPINSEIDGWNGRIDQQAMESGVYAYYAIVETGDSEEIEYTGSITVAK